MLVVADDLNSQTGSYVDEPLKAHTPNLNRLASEGGFQEWVVFGNQRV